MMRLPLAALISNPDCGYLSSEDALADVLFLLAIDPCIDG